VEKDIFTLAMLYSVFLKFKENVTGVFLGTRCWKKVRQEIQLNPNNPSEKEAGSLQGFHVLGCFFLTYNVFFSYNDL